MNYKLTFATGTWQTAQKRNRRPDIRQAGWLQESRQPCLACKGMSM